MKLFSLNKVVASMLVIGCAMPVAFAGDLGFDKDHLIAHVNTDNGNIGDFVVRNSTNTNGEVDTFRSNKHYTTIKNSQGSSLTLDNNGVKLADAVGNGLTLDGIKNGSIAKESNEAVNGSQLFDTNQKSAQNAADIAKNTGDIAQNKKDIAKNTGDIAKNTTAIADHEVRISNNTTAIADHDVRISNNTTAIAEHDVRISNNTANIVNLQSDVASIRSELRDQKSEYRAGIASLAAMTNIPAVPGKTFSFGMGVGNFKNETAFAAGANWNVNESVATKLSVGFESSNVTVGTGVSFGF